MTGESGMHAWHRATSLPLIGYYTFEHELALITFDCTAFFDRFTSAVVSGLFQHRVPRCVLLFPPLREALVNQVSV